MKYLVFIYILFLTNNTLANAALFTGAFGLKFGDVHGKEELKKCFDSADYKECNIIPQKPYHEFSLYGIKLTKNTNKIFHIYAASKSDDFSQCILKAKSISEKIENKYKIKFIGKIVNKTKYRPKQNIWIYSKKYNLQKTASSNNVKRYYQIIEIRCIDKNSSEFVNLSGLLNILYEDTSVILNEQSDDSGL